MGKWLVFGKDDLKSPRNEMVTSDLREGGHKAEAVKKMQEYFN